MTTAVELKHLEVSDAKEIHYYLNNERIAMTYPISLPYTYENVLTYIRQEEKGRLEGERFSFTVKFDKKFVGICALYNVDNARQTAKLYYWIAPDFWNKGIATASLKQLREFAKEYLNLTMLRTGVLDSNKASIKVLVKNRFVIERTFINNDEYHHKFKGKRIIEMKSKLN